MKGFFGLSYDTIPYHKHTTHTMTKSPFEIRADLIKLAQDHLEKQYTANVKFSTKMYESMLESGLDQADKIMKVLPEYQYPTSEDILKKAKEFYNFVSCTK
ncbi:hypothetical protein UFOVP961_59 [uncultured Caudovirales phage]|uniref:Uncharacterized protein n=1 Tax=uncultured Caudovirales phage TaxID=2100421 RepID=A0A6J5PZH9_9CAUD|nr:hypothetical protein UFOVP961_59 [uncultured Caudovirales phage]CAB4185720.1 hypothetical protein UFOVP1123_129 [uncultured Caudovirales phage]CAB4193094.1 hypothetical protein UFOVP1239_22 [uncultured Caudovirales phage]CAB4216224.1 hypothetical protein UFOVP1484_133 [uncultured Caudovirales phage]CAB5230850.1 hypothetical protein UFOVP1577_139 [uncultured Caudovirales phage]